MRYIRLGIFRTWHEAKIVTLIQDTKAVLDILKQGSTYHEYRRVKKVLRELKSNLEGELARRAKETDKKQLTKIESCPYGSIYDE